MQGVRPVMFTTLGHYASVFAWSSPAAIWPFPFHAARQQADAARQRADAAQQEDSDGFTPSQTISSIVVSEPGRSSKTKGAGYISNVLPG